MTTNVIGEGGYGCVFMPRLSCSNESKLTKSKYPTDSYVSKMMITSDAEDELKIIDKLKKHIEKIKNNKHLKKYLNLDKIMDCSPRQLTKTQLNIFKDKCSMLQKTFGINESDLNTYIKNKKIKLINSPYGGVTIQTIFETNLVNMMKKINLKLIELLNKGIFVLNKNNIYHMDIKSNNILIKDETNVQLIDWGMSFVEENKKKGKSISIPSVLNNKPLSFNMPYGAILFSDITDSIVKNFFKKYNITDGNKISEIIFTKLAFELLIEHINKYGEGHFGYILYNSYFLNSDDNILTYVPLRDTNKLFKLYTNSSIEQYISLSGVHYIVNHLSLVLQSFINKKSLKFDKELYFNNVFKHNVDIFGLSTCYFDVIYQILNNNLYSKNRLLVECIQSFVYKYIFSHKFAINKIPIEEITLDIKNMNMYIDGKVPTTPKSIHKDKMVKQKRKKTRKQKPSHSNKKKYSKKVKPKSNLFDRFFSIK